MKFEASTLQFTYPDIEKAIAWYSKLFDRPADFVSSKEFQEWEVYPNCWLQVAKGRVKEDPPRLRLGVPNVEQARKDLGERLGILIEDRFYTKEVVLLFNFDDPWGYHLGIFQDLQRYPLKS